MPNHFITLKSLWRTIQFRAATFRSPDLATQASRIGVPDCRLLVVFIPLLFISSGCTGSSFFSSPRDLIDDGQTQDPTKNQIIIADNTIYQNNRSGVRIRGNTPVLVKKCDIYQNGRAGINLEHSARVVIEQSNIFRNKNSGVGANNVTTFFVKDSMIHQNGKAGVRVREDETSPQSATHASLQQNKIFLNEQGGVHIIATAPTPLQLVVSNNRIYRNHKAGVRIEDNVHMTAANNEVYRNQTAGISSYATGNRTPMLDAYQNKIYFNRGAGVLIHGGVTGRIGLSNNLIYNNYRSGIACGLWGEPGDDLVDVEILHNTIVGNGSDVEGAGIRNDSRGDVLIKDNIIAYNFTTGIMTHGCGGISYNLLFANGETSNTKETTQDQSFLTEKVQYSGCTGRRWGDVLEAPLFVNPDQYNFSLQKNSPARNAAGKINSPYFHDFPSNDLGARPFPSPSK